MHILQMAGLVPDLESLRLDLGLNIMPENYVGQATGQASARPDPVQNSPTLDP